ncbi:MAG: TolC family protein [Pseudomonadota bacterium]|nr:TolC family protein [Pseudomonadota bacterium]
MNRKPLVIRRSLSGVLIWLIAAHAAASGAPPSPDRDGSSGPHDQRAERSGAEPRVDGVLTEREAVRLALGDLSFKEVLAGRVGISESDVTAAGLRPNPELEFESESAKGLGDPSETTFLLSQTLDTSGRRALRRQGAQASLDATRDETQADALERAYEVRRQFYGALHAQQRAMVLRAWDERVGETERIVRERTEAGETSEYDLRRLRHERALARTQRDEVAAQRLQVWETLLASLGPEGGGSERLSGRLLPAPPPPLESLTVRIEQRPDLRALRKREEAARLARRAGERGTIPDITVGVGAKRVADDRREDWELVLGLAVPLPLFDRGQSAVARAEAQSRVAAGEYSLAWREAQGAARGLWQKVERLQQSASRVEARYVGDARSLADTARAAYRGGEVGIIELLDAYRGVMDTELRALDLALEARLAMIELERVAGGTGE